MISHIINKYIVIIFLDYEYNLYKILNLTYILCTSRKSLGQHPGHSLLFVQQTKYALPLTAEGVFVLGIINWRGLFSFHCLIDIVETLCSAFHKRMNIFL